MPTQNLSRDAHDGIRRRIELPLAPHHGCQPPEHPYLPAAVSGGNLSALRIGDTASALTEMLTTKTAGYRAQSLGGARSIKRRGPNRARQSGSRAERLASSIAHKRVLYRTALPLALPFALPEPAS